VDTVKLLIQALGFSAVVIQGAYVYVVVYAPPVRKICSILICDLYVRPTSMLVAKDGIKN